MKPISEWTDAKLRDCPVGFTDPWVVCDALAAEVLRLRQQVVNTVEQLDAVNEARIEAEADLAAARAQDVVCDEHVDEPRLWCDACQAAVRAELTDERAAHALTEAARNNWRDRAQSVEADLAAARAEISERDAAWARCGCAGCA